MNTEPANGKSDRQKAESKHAAYRGTELSLLVSLLGLMVATIGSICVFIMRLDAPEAFPSLPHISLEQVVWLCSVYFVLAGIFVFHAHHTLQMARLGIPFVPSPIPFLGHALLFAAESPWNCMLRWHQERGDILVFPLMGRKVVSLTNPKHLRLALQSKIRAVKKDIDFTYNPFLVILGTGIVTSEGKDWMKQRLKMSTALRIDVLDTIPRTTLEAVQRLMRKLDVAAEKGTPFNIGEALRHLTLQVISETFLSISAEESDNYFGTVYLPIVDECNTRVWHPYRKFCFFMPFWWKHQRNVQKLNVYVSKLITDRWELRQSTNERRNDILDLVLNAYEKEWPGMGLTKDGIRQMRDEFKTFILAGHETSAAMMTWALNELMLDGNLMAKVGGSPLAGLSSVVESDLSEWKLTEEAEAVFGKPNDANWSSCGGVTNPELPSKDRLDDLEYSLACLKVNSPMYRL